MELATAHWTPFPQAGEYRFDNARLRRLWAQLHAADCEPWPEQPGASAAWALFHSGRFAEALQQGLGAGLAGFHVANKASCVYAALLEPHEKVRQSLLLDVAKRAADLCTEQPQHAGAHYWHGYALGRYCEGISVAKALAQGIGGKVKQSLEKAIALQPERADAYIALATFHAEVIDKVGALIAHMTYGVRKDTGLALFTKALSLAPQSPYVLVASAQGRLLLDQAQREPADKLYAQALARKPLDAQEALLQDLAREELGR